MDIAAVVAEDDWLGVEKAMCGEKSCGEVRETARRPGCHTTGEYDPPFTPLQAIQILRTAMIWGYTARF